MLLDVPKHVDADPPIDDIERFTAVQELETGDTWFMLDTCWLDTYVCLFADDTRIIIRRSQHRNISENE